MVWLIGPLERLLLGRVSPNAITLASLLLCGVTGAAVSVRCNACQERQRVDPASRQALSSAPRIVDGMPVLFAVHLPLEPAGDHP